MVQSQPWLCSKLEVSLKTHEILSQKEKKGLLNTKEYTLKSVSTRGPGEMAQWLGDRLLFLRTGVQFSAPT